MIAPVFSGGTPYAFGQMLIQDLSELGKDGDTVLALRPSFFLFEFDKCICYTILVKRLNSLEEQSGSV